MINTINQTIYLKDYTKLDWAIGHVDLTFYLDAEKTRVQAKLHMVLQGNRDGKIILSGEGLTTHHFTIDGQNIDPEALNIIDDHIYLDAPSKDHFIIETEVEINPEANKQLSGLYASSDILCTQCEAEGFRRITWFTDRPDNLATWNVKLIADQKQYPTLLSNGNFVESGIIDEKQHYSLWSDPFPKPSYLFALVAGDLGLLTDNFTTMNGRKVALNIWVLKGNEPRAQWSMACLKNAMAWDEKNYQREYDLDQFNIVSVPDFNMGAMENKSLNIFNDALFLADQQSATDQDFQRIDTVIAHEYFHNWTGNRITCRDWFQLSLKEGLTVYRDQQYTEETYTASSARMDEVSVIRNVQFKEDAGPLSHPVRPDHFVDISNFYTVTIYNKGAEVIRMLHHLLGDEQYNHGIALYFQRHDGKAVTIEDFIQSFEDANHKDLTPFFHWYTQAGTPLVTLTREQKGDDLIIHLKQSLTDQKNKQPHLIPIKIALLSPNGREIHDEQDIILDEWEKSFIFKNTPPHTIPSWNRDFSAPIKTTDDIRFDERLILAAKDPNHFNRADAFFQLALDIMLGMLKGDKMESQKEALAQTLSSALQDHQLSNGDLATLMILPTESYINQQLPIMQPQAVHQARKSLIQYFAQHCLSHLKDRFKQACKQDDGQLTPQSMATRSLIHICLFFLASTNDQDILSYLKTQLTSGKNMTLRASALNFASIYHNETLKEAIKSFEKEFIHEPLVMDKYFRAQASIISPYASQYIEELMQHPAFHLTNPNRLRAVLGTFAATSANLHAADGSGYALMAKYLKKLDQFNPEMASRMAQPLAVAHLLEGKQQKMLISALEEVKNTASSKTLLETIERALKAVIL